MNVLDLFSGIGGFSLGLERAGMRTVQFVEIDPYCRAILRQHWPDVPCHDDVRTFRGTPADVVCAGFPCQDLSVANVTGKGLAGARSGLWRECARVIGAVRPELALLENVAALLDRGLGEVLGDLAALGYDAEWHCLPAVYTCAPHRRDRVWIMAHAQCSRWQGLEPFQSILGREIASLAEHGHAFAGAWRALDGDIRNLRTDDGLSIAMERRRLFALGNAVLPQLVETIGRAIMRVSK